MKIEWRAASFMHCAHSADTRLATIFIHNGAPQALVSCLGGAGVMNSGTITRLTNSETIRGGRGGFGSGVGGPGGAGVSNAWAITSLWNGA
jgi:hypothetical protein